MPYCSIIQCKNESRTKNLSKGGISYHRFPKDPKKKEKWIEATGRQNWCPTKLSTICSQHFDEKFFVTKKSGKKYLLDTAVPERNILNFQSSPQNLPGTSSGIISTSSTKRKLDEISSEASTPRKKKLRSVIELKTSTIRKQELKIRRLRAQNRRLKKKITKIEDILKTLKEKFLMGNEDLTTLKNTNVKFNDLVTRQVQNVKSGVVSTKKYSSELRSFALTLHYYSPKAYEYVRSTFNSSLPHPQTLKKWYATIDGEPGFTKESFVALKLKADAANYPLLATLVIDEMAIRRKTEWDGKKFYGYVDVGSGVEGDHLAEAKEALVFLITALNGNFKIPVAFFLVDGVTGAQRAELVKQCIERVHDSGVKVVALTFDGCAANVSMAHNLGCSFQGGNINFLHPITKSPIVVVLDL